MEGGSNESECWNLWSVVNVFTGINRIRSKIFKKGWWLALATRVEWNTRSPRFRGQSERGIRNLFTLNYTRIRGKYLFRGSIRPTIGGHNPAQWMQSTFLHEFLISNSRPFFLIRISFVVSFAKYNLSIPPTLSATQLVEQTWSNTEPIRTIFRILDSRRSVIKYIAW